MDETEFALVSEQKADPYRIARANSRSCLDLRCRRALPSLPTLRSSARARAATPSALERRLGDSVDAKCATSGEGVHTGEVEIMGDDVGGIAVHIAARVAQHAKASEVLASSTVKDLVAGAGLKFVDQGPAELKGLAEPMHLFAAVT
ncbi:hypothetical protein IVB20_29040 [Bradyrhizobium sp. 188]|nr:hypothetical protein [Bradyrhizobium sp. 188]